MGLKENFNKDRIEQLNMREAVTVPPTASVRDAVQLMREKDIGCAIVVDEDRKPIGIFTESMLTETLAHRPATLDESIQDHMADRCPWVRTSDTVAELLEAMQLKNVRSVCVVDEHDRVVGLSGQRGLMEYVADHFPGQVMVQRVGLSPYYSEREGA
jgi:CBS domain-containing protein